MWAWRSTLEVDRNASALPSHVHVFDTLADTRLNGFDGLFWWSWSTSIEVTSWAGLVVFVQHV